MHPGTTQYNTNLICITHISLTHLAGLTPNIHPKGPTYSMLYKQSMSHINCQMKHSVYTYGSKQCNIYNCPIYTHPTLTTHLTKLFLLSSAHSWLNLIWRHRAYRNTFLNTADCIHTAHITLFKTVRNPKKYI